MMDLMTKRELESLIEESSGKTLSIYLPTERVGRETEEGRIHLKNALKEAEKLLSKGGKSPQAIERFLQGAEALLHDGLFWQHQSDGLALFIDGNATDTYRLPIKFEPFVDYNDVPYIQPLFPLFYDNRLFYVLALSQNQLRLVKCTHYEAQVIDLEDLPISIKEYTTFEDPDTHQVFERQSEQKGNRQASGYVGHGVDQMDNKERIAHFFHEVDHGLSKYLEDPEAPLLLAGVDYLTALYREISTKKNLLSDSLSGNPEAFSAEELKEAAWPFIDDLRKKEQARVLERFEILRTKGKAEDQIESIAFAAFHGRVDTLVLKKGLHTWGHFDFESQTVERAEEKEGTDLCNFAALHAFMGGGQVYVLDADDLPEDSQHFALLRY